MFVYDAVNLKDFLFSWKKKDALYLSNHKINYLNNTVYPNDHQINDTNDTVV